MTAKIDGDSWASDDMYLASGAVVATQGTYVIQGAHVTSSSSVLSIQLALYNVTGPGTYPLGVGPSVGGGTGTVATGAAGWLTPLSGANGSVTIEKISADRISGSFEFDADAGVGSATGTRSVTEGDFDLPLTLNGTVTTPLSDVPGSRLTATVGGESWNASTIASLVSDHTLVISTNNTAYSISMSLMEAVDTGTYVLSSTNPIRSLLVSGPGADPRGDHCCWGGSIVIHGDGTVTTSDVGSVHITSLTPTRAKGTFSATLAPAPSAPTAEPLEIVDGIFDVKIQSLP